MKRTFMLEKLGARLERVVRSTMPDPFVLVLLLTILTFAMSAWFTPTHPHELLDSWNKGFWELLSFAMQMVLIVVTGEAIAESSVMQKVLRKFSSIPRSARSGVVLLTLFSIVLGWLHW